MFYSVDERITAYFISRTGKYDKLKNNICCANIIHSEFFCKFTSAPSISLLF